MKFFFGAGGCDIFGGFEKYSGERVESGGVKFFG